MLTSATLDARDAARVVVIELSAGLPPGRVLVDEDATARYRRDQAPWADHGTPICVVRPRTAEEVQTIVQICLRHHTPVVPRGAGTGLSGAANAVDGCVLLSTEQMTTIQEIDAAERLAVVEPGVVNDDLRAACAEQGLWYPPDPASAPWSTIGGNVATNAGGLCCVKYGVTGDYVLGLQVVTGSGDLVRIGRRTAKGVAGYDLTALLVGSEGTLGVITEVTVRLRPARDPEHTVAGYFPSLTAAGRAVAAVAAAGLTPSALELIDRQTLLAVDAWKNMGLSADADAVLLARTDAPGAAGAAEAEALLACFRGEGAAWAAASSDEAESEALFSARKLAYPALERLGHVLVEDVCVPRGAVPDMLGSIERIAGQRRVRIATVAHAGDGNLHPVFVVPAGDDNARRRAEQAFEEILDAALALGGTVTGEHGIGLLKRAGLTRELPEPVLAMHTAVKQALDPHGILNPGKVIACAPRS